MLRSEFERSGNWLFQRRSHLPLLLLPLIVFALTRHEFVERVFGESVELYWEVFCILLSGAGLLVRCLTVGWVSPGTSGRNTKGQLADSLNTEGMYSIVRHPLYLANFIVLIGLILYTQAIWLALIASLCFWLYYERIMFAEEEFLSRKFGDAYMHWAKETPTFIPHFSQWKRPEKKFSLQMVLKREYTTLLGIVIAFILLEFFGEFLSERILKFYPLWWALLAAVFTSYFVLRHLRKRTRVLG